jgi:hypothetical protein
LHHSIADGETALVVRSFNFAEMALRTGQQISYSARLPLSAHCGFIRRLRARASIRCRQFAVAVSSC